MTTYQSPTAPVPAVAATRQLEIEFLFLDLQTCTRCLGTDTTLREALDLVRPALAATGITINVTKRLIESEADAQRYRFVTSPTIQIDGKDIAGPLIESSCDSCSELCGCNGGVDCRMWRYQGQDYPEAPTGLIVEAILRHAATPAPVSVPEPYSVPENLKQFFRSRSEAAERAAAGNLVASLECCPSAEQASCCDTGEKATCCGTAATNQSAAACGCR